MRNIKKLFLLIAIIIITGCSNLTETKVIKEYPPLTEEAPRPKPKKPEHFSASISAVGDILIHSSVYNDAYIGNNQYDFTKMFTHVKPYLESTDITFANSESIIGGQKIGLSHYPRFNSPFEVGNVLKDVGVDVVSMANNHTLDRGEEAILNATKHWNDLGITYVGAARNKEETEQIKTLTANGITFAFLAYTYGTNGLVTPKGKEYLVNYIDETKIKMDIQNAKSLADVVVVSLHIGNEYERKISDYQEKIAQLAADSGAHIIFAHHPHVLQPVKWYEGTHGNKTFVIHSLGNFLSAQDELYRQIGAIMQLDVNKTITYDREGNASSTIEITNPSLLPTYVKFSNWKDYEIIPLHKVSKEVLPNRDQLYGEIKTYMSQYVPELFFIEDH
ncbi:poly-gamma-glutamate synthesis protein (capsule biosynthesis protein) [Ureibacillus xyleni]|uniref:Poly-gamma-glutamate synthesis protein (Capsule biosynthesis protein) n=1 Tax=Ureibacillus xyleni TaxID=614648 RepID=A0A285TPN6_9BACL|nr:CapA family protein [Ureibacillus xyleni]SOC22678.1 poly-gamma-glutamate synthesis protein (capsule biosynthesis protein) [Ureibacillus xyleni]